MKNAAALILKCYDARMTIWQKMARGAGVVLVLSVGTASVSPVLAQTLPQNGAQPAALNIPNDPLCQPLRDCARASLPQLDDMTSAPDVISARVARACDAQMITCNDAVMAGTRQQIVNGKMANAVQLQDDLAKPESRVLMDKTLTKTVLNVEVDLHRYQVTGQVPADATAGHAAPPAVAAP